MNIHAQLVIRPWKKYSTHKTAFARQPQHQALGNTIGLCLDSILLGISLGRGRKTSREYLGLELDSKHKRETEEGDRPSK